MQVGDGRDSHGVGEEVVDGPCGPELQAASLASTLATALDAAGSMPLRARYSSSRFCMPHSLTSMANIFSSSRLQRKSCLLVGLVNSRCSLASSSSHTFLATNSPEVG